MSIAPLVERLNSIAILPRMTTDKKSLEPWQAEDAARLKALFDVREPRLSQAEFGALHEIGSQGMVWQYLAGRRPLNIKAATAFARGLGVGIADISPTLAAQVAVASDLAPSTEARPHVLRSGQFRPVVIADAEDPGFYQIRKVQLCLRAGVTGFQTVPEIFDGSTISVPRNWADRHGYSPKNLVAVTVKGESMEPSLYAGDTVVVNTADTTRMDGVVYAFNYEGEAVIKRLARDSGQWWLSSDNADQRRFPRKRCDGMECMIVGRIVLRETERI